VFHWRVFVTPATRRWITQHWIDYTGYLITDGDHDSEQSDRVLCIDSRPRGRVLFHAKRHRPPTPSPSSRPFLPRGSPPPSSPPPHPRLLSNLGSGRRWRADAGSFIAESYTLAVAGGRRRRGEAAATAGRGGGNGGARRRQRRGNAAWTGGRGGGDGGQGVVDDMAPVSLGGAFGNSGKAGKVGGGHVVCGGWSLVGGWGQVVKWWEGCGGRLVVVCCRLQATDAPLKLGWPILSESVAGWAPVCHEASVTGSAGTAGTSAMPARASGGLWIQRNSMECRLGRECAHTRRLPPPARKGDRTRKCELDPDRSTWSVMFRALRRWEALCALNPSITALFFEPTSATGTKSCVFPGASCRYVYSMFGIISRQQRPWGEKPTGNRAGIDDFGDPLCASLIQNRARDNTWV